MEVEPAATATEAGTTSKALLLDRDTEVELAGALETVTVQVLLADEPRLVGEQTSAVTVTGATRVMVAVCDTPLNVAVTVTD